MSVLRASHSEVMRNLRIMLDEGNEKQSSEAVRCDDRETNMSFAVTTVVKNRPPFLSTK